MATTSERTPLVAKPGVVAPAEKSALGGKTISLLGSLVLNVNNLSGPGMLAVPLLFQQAGWLLPSITLVVMTVLTSYSATLLCEAMVLVPGNDRLQKRIEFSTVVEHYYGKKWYYVTQIIYSLSLTTLNVASIIVSAQVMDQFFVFLFKKSFALQLYPFSIVTATDTSEMFGDYGVIISLGYLVCLVLCMPMGFLNLDENIYFQYVSFLVLVGILGEFFVQFFLGTLDFAAVPMVRTDGISSVVGTIMFNYTFVVTVPSWVNEKKEKVSVNKAVWISAIGCSIGYFCFGYVGAIANPGLTSADANILTVLASKDGASKFAQWSVYIFSIGVIGLGIPLFCVMVRYNLYVGRVFGKFGSAFWGVLFPWIISFLLYQGDGFGVFVTWASLFINSFINFVLPMILYRTARMRHRYGDEMRVVQPEEGGSLIVGGLDTSLTSKPSSSVGLHHQAARRGSCCSSVTSLDGPEDGSSEFVRTTVNSLPTFLIKYSRARGLALGLGIVAILLTLVAIAYQFVALAQN